MEERPKPLQPSKSFTRLESTQPKGPLTRSRASTLQGSPLPDMLGPLKESLSPEEEEDHADGSVFAKQQNDDEATAQSPQAPDSFEELPIEIRSLTERCSTSILTYRFTLMLFVDSSNPSLQKCIPAPSPPIASQTSFKISTHEPPLISIHISRRCPLDYREQTLGHHPEKGQLRKAPGKEAVRLGSSKCSL
jgi:hypothetical protein